MSAPVRHETASPRVTSNARLLMLFVCLLPIHGLLPDRFGAASSVFHSAAPWMFLPAFGIAALLASKRSPWAFLAIPPALFQAWVLAPTGFRGEPRDPLVVVTANAYFRIEDPAAQAAMFLKSDADVLALQEFTPALEALLDTPEARTRFPHRMTWATAGPKGMGLYSRYPMDPTPYVPRSRWMHARIRGIDVYSVHLSPPKSMAATQDRADELEAIADLVRPSTTPSIVLGDFNIAPTSPDFRHFLADSALRDQVAWCGRSWTNTWGFRLLPALVRIDQVVASSNLVCSEAATLPRAGSDHAPVRVRLGRR